MGENYPTRCYFSPKSIYKTVFTPINNKIYPIIYRKLRIFASVKTKALGNAKSSSFTYTNKQAMVSIRVSKPLLFLYISN